ncbi:MAG: antitoxin [Nitrospirae bacterium]|nr:antitoxin [Nitrospirota bacterium]
MASITVRGIDEELRKLLKESATREGLSLNAYLLKMIKESLGVEKRKRSRRYHDLDHLAGTWSEKDFKAFEEAVKDFERIDSEIW